MANLSQHSTWIVPITTVRSRVMAEAGTRLAPMLILTENISRLVQCGTREASITQDTAELFTINGRASSLWNQLKWWCEGVKHVLKFPESQCMWHACFLNVLRTCMYLCMHVYMYLWFEFSSYSVYMRCMFSKYTGKQKYVFHILLDSDIFVIKPLVNLAVLD